MLLIEQTECILSKFNPSAIQMLILNFFMLDDVADAMKLINFWDKFILEFQKMILIFWYQISLRCLLILVKFGNWDQEIKIHIAKWKVTKNFLSDQL